MNEKSHPVVLESKEGMRERKREKLEKERPSELQPINR